MKKVVLAIVCLGILLAAPIRTIGKDFIQVDFNSERVLPNKALNQGFADILAYDKMDFIIVSGSTAITTASVRWIQNDGTLISSNVLTSGTPITNFLSNWMSIVIPNGTATRNFSGNIRLINN